MALRIDIPAGPLWIDIRPGIRFFVLPLTAMLESVARQEAFAEAEAMARAYRAAKDAGQLASDALDISSPAAAEGLGQVIYARVLARHALRDWEGVETAEGKAPVNAANIDAVMNLYQLPMDFLTAYSAGMLLLHSEKKGSAAAPPGTGATAAEQTTAAAAPETAGAEPMRHLLFSQGGVTEAATVPAGAAPTT